MIDSLASIFEPLTGPNGTLILPLLEVDLYLYPRELVLILFYTPIVALIWKVLEVNLFQPFLALHEARERATAGSKANASSILEEAARLEADYDSQLLEARTSAIQERLNKLSQASQEAAETVGKAEADAAAKLRQARRNLQSEIETIRADAFRDIEAMVDEAVASLGKAPQPSVDKSSRIH